MVDAKALFKRHWEQFKIVEKEPGTLEAIIYAACIIAEAIRNSADFD